MPSEGCGGDLGAGAVQGPAAVAGQGTEGQQAALGHADRATDIGGADGRLGAVQGPVAAGDEIGHVQRTGEGLLNVATDGRQAHVSTGRSERPVTQRVERVG